MAVTREYTITYGTYEVEPDGRVTLERDRERGSLGFAFVVSATTEAAFGTAVRAAEAAFQKPYQDLTWEQGSETILDASQTGRKALDPMPRIEKREEVGSSGRSRRYHVRVEFGLPADTGAEPVEGLRDSVVDVRWSPERIRTVTISGTFTGVGVTSARDKYEAQIATLVTSVMSDLSIAASARELAEEPSVTHDTNNNVTDFSIIYQELVFSQGGSSLDDAALVGQRLTIARRREEPGRTPEATALVTLDLTYETGVDKTVSTDLRGKYAAIRGWLLDQVQNTLDGGGVVAVMSEEASFDYDENRFSARWVVVAPATSGPLERRVTVDDDDTVGAEVLPVWGGIDTDAHVWQGPRVVVRSVTETLRVLGTHTEQDAMQFGAGEVATARARRPWQANGGRWVTLSRRPGATPLRIGVDPDTFDVTDLTLTTRMRYVTTPSPVSGGAAGGPAVTDPRS